MSVTANITTDAEWFVGEDKTLTFTVVDANNVTVDISGWSLEWDLRLTRYNPTVLLTKDTSAGIVVDPDQVTNKGKFYVQVDRSDTTGLKAGTYYHAAARTNTGNFDVVSEGSAVLRKAAAR